MFSDNGLIARRQTGGMVVTPRSAEQEGTSQGLT